MVQGGWSIKQDTPPDWEEITNKPTEAELKGDPPDHQWDGTSLRFQKPDLSWGPLTNLIGLQGPQGPEGPIGATGATGPIGSQGPAGLEDIEQGSWTPQLITSASNVEPSYATQIGYYYRIKKHIFVSGILILSAIPAVSGSLRIVNLPFLCLTSPNVSYSLSIGFCRSLSLDAGFQLSGLIVAGTSYINLYQIRFTDTAATAVWNNFTNTSQLYFSGSYVAI